MPPSALMEKLISQRKSLGISQRELAARIGVVHATVGHFESGRNIPDPPTIAKIAQALGLELVMDVLKPEEARPYRFVEIVRDLNELDMSRLERIARVMGAVKDEALKEALTMTLEGAGGLRQSRAS